MYNDLAYMDEQLAIEKYNKLQENLKDLGRVMIAFSSGVDSTFLLKAAHDVLGENAIAITAGASLFPEREKSEAIDFCIRENIRHIILDRDVFSINGFADNPPDRCYLCKHALFSGFLKAASEEQIRYVAEGSNMDDKDDYRPGLRAIKELGIISPLQEAGLYKNEIRFLSRKLGLDTWEKPSFACLASRFVYGETITNEKLLMVDRAEKLLLEMGFEQFRVRIHGTIARIEILPDDFMKLMSDGNRVRIIEQFKSYGFTYVAMDLQGYRTGSMNEVL